MRYNTRKVSAMADGSTSRDIRAKEAIDAVKSGSSNAELMERFKISAQGFADLLRQLFERKLITEDDLSKRGIRFKVVKKEGLPEALLSTVPETVKPPDDFLDTEDLTELLTFKDPAEETPTRKIVPPAPSPPLVEEKPPAPETAQKKGRFSLSKLFKKDA